MRQAITNRFQTFILGKIKVSSIRDKYSIHDSWSDLSKEPRA